MLTTKKLNRMIKFIFSTLVFLLPFFFLPWTTTLSGMDNFNKQNLFFVLMPILGFLFLIACFQTEKINFKTSAFDYPIWGFLGAITAASILSIDKFSSIFGSYSYIEQSLILVFCLVLLYFFVINFFNSESDVYRFLKIYFKIYTVLIFASSALVISYWLKLLSSETISLWFKLSVGTLDDLAILIAVLNVLLFGLLYDSSYLRSLSNSFWGGRLLKVAMFLSFVLLILINFNIAWWGLLLGALFVSYLNYFNSENKKEFKQKFVGFLKQKKLFWLNISILISLLILCFNFATYSEALSLKRSAQKLQMGYSSTLELSRQTILNRPVFGYGPEAYNMRFHIYDRGLII